MGGFPSSNIGVTGPLDALDSALGGYFEGRQAAQSLRDQRLKEARQNLLDQSTLKHQQSQDDYWQGMVANGGMRATNQGDAIKNRANAANQGNFLKLGMDIAGQPVDVQRSRVSDFNTRNGTSYGLPNDPVMDENGQPVLGPDGQPQLIPAYGLSPEQQAKLDRFKELAKRSAGFESAKLFASLGTNPDPTQAQSAFDAYNQRNPDYPIQPPMRSSNYGYAGGDLDALKAALGNPGLSGTLKLPDGKTVDLDALRKMPASVIDTSPNGVNAAKMALDQALGNKANVWSNDVAPTIEDLNKANATFVRGAKTDDTVANTNYTKGAKTDNTNANTAFTKTKNDWFGKNEQSLIDLRANGGAGKDARQIDRYGAEQQVMINTGANVAMQLSAIGLKKDANGNYIPLGGDMTHPVYGADKKAIPGLSRDAVNALVEKYNSAHQRAMRLQQLISAPPNGLGQPGSSASGVRLQSPDAGNLPMGVTKSGNKYQIVGP